MTLLLNSIFFATGIALFLHFGTVRCEIETPNAPETAANDYSNLCPMANSKLPVYASHPEDCTRFFICDNGIPYLKKCPVGLHFNRDLKACDYPELAGCDKSVIKVPEGRITGDESTLCPAENSKYPVLISHPDDCSKFYICNSGSAYLQQCHSGLHFNPKLKACDYPETARCDPDFNELPKGKITGDDLGLCPAQNSKYPVLLPHPHDCNKFYICDSGLMHLKQCQPGLHFNPKIKACDYPKNAECETDFKELPKGKVNEDDQRLCPAKNSKYPVLLPHPDDCSKFYICDSGFAHLKQCQSGLHFNPKINTCDYKKNARCNTEMKTALSGVPSVFCPLVNGRTPIFYRHPTNCSVYYMCGNGLAYEFVCPSRLHFNVRKKVCDYIQNSSCQNIN